MITEDYVSFETAKLLKEKGFNERCSHAYREDGEHMYCGDVKLIETSNTEIQNPKDWVSKLLVCTCPTLQMAMKWLREAHNLFLSIQLHMDGSYVWYVYHTIHLIPKGADREPHSHSYEEACEAAIKYCLENLI